MVAEKSKLNREKSKPSEFLADGLNAIPYRPELRTVAGSVNATLLLQQLLYWWKRSGYKPFYKFLRPCQHRDYRRGDSWAEELNFTRYEFDKALGKIAVKVKQGNDKRAAWESGAFALFWTDRDRKSWFVVNTKAIDKAIEEAGIYVGDQSAEEAEPEPRPIHAVPDTGWEDVC